MPKGTAAKKENIHQRIVSLFLYLISSVIGMNGKLAAGGLEAAVDESLESINPHTCGRLPLLSVAIVTRAVMN